MRFASISASSLAIRVTSFQIHESLGRKLLLFIFYTILCWLHINKIIIAYQIMNTTNSQNDQSTNQFPIFLFIFLHTYIIQSSQPKSEEAKTCIHVFFSTNYTSAQMAAKLALHWFWFCLLVFYLPEPKAQSELNFWIHLLIVSLAEFIDWVMTAQCHMQLTNKISCLPFP